MTFRTSPNCAIPDPVHGGGVRLRLPKTVTGVQSHAPGAGFNVVIAYEDFTAGRRAIDACKLLVAQLGNEVRFRSSMWKFDVLEVAKLNRMATHDAVEADMIIVATAQNGELPGAVKVWVESWVPEKRGQTAALLALMDFSDVSELDGANLARDYLQNAAAEAGIDFLQQSDQPMEQSWAPPTAGPLGNGTASLRITNRPAPEGWGLND